MTLKEFINFLVEIGAKFKVEEEYDMVYVYGKKNERGYTPYLRVSNFGREDLYTKRDGILNYMCDEHVKNICIELTKENEES